MTETDKLLVKIGTARDAISRKTEQTSLDYMIDGVLMNCSVLLKEQKAREQCLKTKCVICPHCINCDVDENGLLKEQEPVMVYEAKISKCSCGNIVNRYYHPKFCGCCGKELMWY